MIIKWFSTATLAAFAVLGTASGAQSISAPSQALDQPGTQTDTIQSERTQTPGNEHATSQVRIVRLSQTKGEVRLDRQTGQSFEEAFVNIPIIAGERLKTGDGLAEVEFEDNSSLRLTPNSLVEFPVLGRDASGATTTTVKVVSGTVYVSMATAKGADGFTILAGNEKIMLGPLSHLRLDLTTPVAKLVVFKGSATVADPSGTMVVDKKKAITFDTASGAAPVMAHNDGAAIFDKWDKTESDYHQARSAAMTFANSPYTYGTSDLSYYGSFASYDGCGMMWRPYLVSAAWNPYGSGVWALYPGAGYSWVSPYPWGWTPYHSGSWAFCPSSGSWGWQPGGSWNGLNNLVASRTTRGRPSLPEPPRANASSLVAVNVKSLAASRTGAGGSFVFARDSAGLGVPRGTFGNLGKISQNVAERGSVTTAVSESQGERGMIPASRASSNVAAASTHASYSGVSATSPSSSVGRSSSSAMSSSASHAGASGGSSGGHH